MNDLPEAAASDACAAVTPEMRKQDRKRARRRALRHRIVLLWAGTGYRPWARLLHRFDLHHARRAQIDPTYRRCEWCGLSGRIYEPGVLLREAGEQRG